MAEPTHPSPVPWLAVEAVLLALSRLGPASVALTRDPGNRVARHLRDVAPDEPSVVLVEASCPQRVACVVWIGDGVTATADARVDVVAHASRCEHDVLLCEPIVPGAGVGLQMLRAIDVRAVEVITDEIGDGPERTRECRPWEPKARWIVAVASAWRFGDHAELARDGFVARLRRMTPEQMVLAARRVLARFPKAYEVFLLAIEELSRRGDESGTRQMWNELGHHGPAAGSATHRARACVLDTFVHDWGAPARHRAAG